MNEGREVPVLVCSLQEPEHLWWWSLSRDCRDSGLPFTDYVALGEAPNFSVILLFLFNRMTVPTEHRPHLLGLLEKFKNPKKEGSCKL